MIRILIFILVLTLAAAGLTALLAVDGNIHIRFGDYVYFNPAAPTLIGISILLALLIVTVLIISYLMRLPEKLRGKRRDSQRQKGIISLTRGLEAVAAGDASDAQRHAKNAQRQLEEPALTRLLTAQAAQLAGDHETAEASFSAMLEAPETEFLGLRGLYLQAVGAGDMKAAKGYADRAFKLRPNARWAYESVYQLSVERGSWSDAQSALKLASRNGLEDGEHVKRHEAALITARAYAADASGERDDALSDAKDAFKLAPDFPPAAVLAARLEAGKSRRKAVKILEQAWAARPHPAIRQTWLDVHSDLAPDERVATLPRLAGQNPHDQQSQHLLAEAAIAQGNHDKARDILQPLFSRRPTVRTFTLMAQAMKARFGEEAAEPWLEKAAHAPAEPGPGADGTFHFSTDGWRRLVMEFGDHHRLSPPPLEEMTAAMSQDEVLMLAAPPPVPEPPAPEPEPEAVPEDVVADGSATVEATPETSPAAEQDKPAAPQAGTSGEKPAAEDLSAQERKRAEQEKELKEKEATLSAAGMGGGMYDEDER
ncbi:heme biosynthesis protein HemY [Aquisalinus flavus]|uniref:Membrane protein n=1 Tax=Aquisalinus flavus TaxID=1526572 RepID=A0A8J2V7S7_9PROT|nr:heme biosynthesis HemY N-terminal domain-containing protein [Aquisalinus flavus]MBD0425509.1 hypothetical protein [Aquisalinus flavus]UNE48860.1 hypothetical protein FF099_12770 [Aquisalinus flavus]GGD15522.1 membrane protein [Aquisalinus flavus]